MDFKIIAVDFDGTLCENKWPEIGEPNREIISYLKEQQVAGAKLILWTCRVDELLKNAVRWSAEQGLIFDAVNENLPEILTAFKTDTRKIFANEYVDDRNSIVPMITKKRIQAARNCLIANGIEAEEADTVLQAIGYILLNQELYPEKTEKGHGDEPK